MEFELLSPSKSKELLDLLTGLYPHLGWNEAYWKWQYQENPAGYARSWVASRGEKIIGNFTAIPFETYVKGKICLGWRAQDVLTLPAYSGFGVYFRLSTMANEFLKTAEHPFNFAFPNERSHSGFIKNQWTAAFRIPHWILDDKSKIIKKAIAADIQPLASFDQRAEHIWKSYASQIDFAVNRDAEYLNWRYFKRPGAEYFPFILSYGGEELIIILKYFDRPNEGRWAHICDLFQSGKNASLYEAGIQHALNFAHQHGCKAISCWQPEGTVAQVLTRFSFILQKDLTRWFLVNLNSKPQECLDEARWHLSMGDSDVY